MGLALVGLGWEEEMGFDWIQRGFWVKRLFKQDKGLNHSSFFLQLDKSDTEQSLRHTTEEPSVPCSCMISPSTPRT